MKQVAAAAGLVAALAGVVGGVAYAQTREPVKAEAPMVVVPEAQLIAQTGTPTVAASPTAVPVVKAAAPKAVAPKPVAPKPAPVKVAAVKPAPVKAAAPLSSSKTVVKKAATTSRSLAVAADPTPADPKPTPRETGTVVKNDDGSTTIQMKPGQLPPVIPAKPAPEPSPEG